MCKRISGGILYGHHSTPLLGGAENDGAAKPKQPPEDSGLTRALHVPRLLTSQQPTPYSNKTFMEQHWALMTLKPSALHIQPPLLQMLLYSPIRTLDNKVPLRLIHAPLQLLLGSSLAMQVSRYLLNMDSMNPNSHPPIYSLAE